MNLTPPAGTHSHTVYSFDFKFQHTRIKSAIATRHSELHDIFFELQAHGTNEAKVADG